LNANAILADGVVVRSILTGMMGLWLGSGAGCAFVGATVGCLRYSATPVATAAMTTTGTAMATAMIALDDWGESAGGAVVVPGCAVIPPSPEGAGAGAVAIDRRG